MLHAIHTPASCRTAMNKATALREQFSADRLCEMQQQRRAAGKGTSEILTYAIYLARIAPVK